MGKNVEKSIHNIFFAIWRKCNIFTKIVLVPKSSLVG